VRYKAGDTVEIAPNKLGVLNEEGAQKLNAIKEMEENESILKMIWRMIEVAGYIVFILLGGLLKAVKEKLCAPKNETVKNGQRSYTQANYTFLVIGCFLMLGVMIVLYM